MAKSTKRKEAEHPERTGSTPTNKGQKTENSTQLDMSESSTKSETPIKENLSYAEVLADTQRKLEDETAESTASKRSTFDRNYQGPGKTTGQFRDQIVVDILTIDGKVLKDQLTVNEKLKIYEKMGLKGANYNGVSPGFTSHPVYTYRLKNKIDVTSNTLCFMRKTTLPLSAWMTKLR